MVMYTYKISLTYTLVAMETVHNRVLSPPQHKQQTGL